MLVRVEMCAGENTYWDSLWEELRGSRMGSIQCHYLSERLSQGYVMR